MPVPTAAWSVTRRGLVVHVHLQWPLVASDWSSLVWELSQQIEDGAKAVVLPTQLPSGSRVPAKKLDELWLTLVDMSITVERSASAHGVSSEASVH
jgi:hypothetical protein